MSEPHNKIKLFQERQVRAVWDEQREKWWLSVVDVVSVLTEQADDLKARKYWNKLKQRLKDEGNETVTNCHQLRMLARDGKMRLTDVADTEQILRLIQSIPSKKKPGNSARRWQGMPVMKRGQVWWNSTRRWAAKSKRATPGAVFLA